MKREASLFAKKISPPLLCSLHYLSFWLLILFGRSHFGLLTFVLLLLLICVVLLLYVFFHGDRASRLQWGSSFNHLSLCLWLFLNRWLCLCDRRCNLSFCLLLLRCHSRKLLEWDEGLDIGETAQVEGVRSCLRVTLGRLKQLLGHSETWKLLSHLFYWVWSWHHELLLRRG